MLSYKTARAILYSTNNMHRFYTPFITHDLERKMVFVGGPRQVGKTTLCQSIAHHQANYKDASHYLNWDVDEDRAIITQKAWYQHHRLIIFDELHKFSRWKQWIKGVYDSKPAHQQLMVTGSARLDTYKKGGDSLLGRYHYWRLHPLTLDELPEHIPPEEGYDRLLQLGGFPEPFLLGDIREAKRWRRERFTRIIREDIRDLTRIQDIRLLELYVDALRQRAGQLIVQSNLAEDLHISPVTAKQWMQVIADMYIGFAIYPLTRNVPRSIQKPPKWYFYDNADTQEDKGMRLENLIATTLLKRLHFYEDYYGDQCSLHYIRDRNNREVDFAVVINGELTDLIEVKSSDTSITKSLAYYSQMLKPKRTTQIVGSCKRGFEKNGIKVMNPIEFFRQYVPFTVT